MSEAKRIRPSSADREPYAAALAEAHAEGRLDAPTFEERLEQLESATSGDELEQLVADVPFTRPPDPEVVKHRRASRRSVLLGGFGLLAVGTVSYGATQRWVESTAPRPVEPPPTAAATPRGTSTPSPGSVATTLFQVPMYTPQMFPVLIDHATGIGIRKISSVRTWSNNFAEVIGRHKDGRDLKVSHHSGDRSSWTVDHPEDHYFKPSRIRDLDIADLIARSKDRIAITDEPSVTVRHLSPDGWTIRIDGDTESVAWNLAGTKIIPE